MFLLAFEPLDALKPLNKLGPVALKEGGSVHDLELTDHPIRDVIGLMCPGQKDIQKLRTVLGERFSVPLQDD